MKKETNTPPPLRATAEASTGLEVRAEATAQFGPVPKPPEKPPWQRFMDLNWNALEWLAGNPMVQWVVGNSIWTWLFGRRRQPAEQVVG